ncbi:MAG: ABC transporter permease [Bdellovibrionales bacterium]|nr:ABC transporter permease [Bdellovibrionales bacterium]
MKSFAKKFLRHRVALASLVFLAVVSVGAGFAPVFTRQSYEVQNIEEKLETPNAQHWMGTDTLGRDLYSRVVYGARMSLSVGVITALLSLTVGTLVGAIAGYRGGKIDAALMRVVDVFYIFPSLLIAILLTVYFGRGFLGILVAITLTSWVTHARLVRNLVLQSKEMLYVESARSLGLSGTRILLRHILPNILGPMIVSLTFQIPTNIMSESFLSFIGLGLEPPYSSWGTLANEGFRAMKSFPHLILFPGTVLFVTLLAFNALGDGVRDVLDPRGKRDFGA